MRAISIPRRGFNARTGRLGTTLALLHLNENAFGDPAQQYAINYAPGGQPYLNQGLGTNYGGQGWFDDSTPFGRGWHMEDPGGNPCAISSPSRISVPGMWAHEIFIDKLDENERPVWQIGTPETDYYRLMGLTPTGNNVWILRFSTPAQNYESNPIDLTGVPYLYLRTVKTPLGYYKVGLNGNLIIDSQALGGPQELSATAGDFDIFGGYDYSNSSGYGVFQAAIGELRFRINDPSLMTFPHAVPATRFAY